MQVKDLMTEGAVTLSEEASVLNAARMMDEANVGAILATDVDGMLSGILTDRQITCQCVARGDSPEEVPISSIMTRDPFTARPNMDLMEAAKIMGKNKIRRLPVVNEFGEIEGIISIVDLAEHVKNYSAWIFEEVSKSKKKELLSAHYA